MLLTSTAYGPVFTQSRLNLTFPATAVGTPSASQTFTVGNKGNFELAKPGGGSIVSITGPDASSFSQTNTCGTTPLAAGKTCTITVTFNPTTTGTLKAQVTLTDNAYPRPQTVNLTGTGQ